jgi:hypothetical protein
VYLEDISNDGRAIGATFGGRELEQLVIQETHLGSSLLVAQQRDSSYGAKSVGCILILARYPLEIAAFRAVDVSSGIIIQKHTFAQKISFRFM